MHHPLPSPLPCCRRVQPAHNCGHQRRHQRRNCACCAPRHHARRCGGHLPHPGLQRCPGHRQGGLVVACASATQLPVPLALGPTLDHCPAYRPSIPPQHCAPWPTHVCRWAARCVATTQLRTLMARLPSRLCSPTPTPRPPRCGSRLPWWWAPRAATPLSCPLRALLWVSVQDAVQRCCPVVMQWQVTVESLASWRGGPPLHTCTPLTCAFPPPVCRHPCHAAPVQRAGRQGRSHLQHHRRAHGCRVHSDRLQGRHAAVASQVRASQAGFLREHGALASALKQGASMARAPRVLSCMTLQAAVGRAALPPPPTAGAAPGAGL